MPAQRVESREVEDQDLRESVEGRTGVLDAVRLDIFGRVSATGGRMTMTMMRWRWRKDDSHERDEADRQAAQKGVTCAPKCSFRAQRAFPPYSHGAVVQYNRSTNIHGFFYYLNLHL
jgi:hypothetical protein